MQLSQSIRQQLADHFNIPIMADDWEEQADCVLELVNRTQLLAWPSFRRCFATTDEEEYLQQASAFLTTNEFAERWVSRILKAAKRKH